MAQLLITTKRYVITTSDLNCFKFRALTDGVDYSQYLNNPILLFMHVRAPGYRKDEILPLGKAIEIQIEGDALACRLAFDPDDTFAVSVYNKYESGIYNMLSAGLEPLEWSQEPEMMVQGQTGPTLVKSMLKEVSCVDIGANPEAYGIALYDQSGSRINLSAETIKSLIPATTQTQNSDMKLVTLSAPTLGVILADLKLNADTATEAEVTEKVSQLVTLASNQALQITNLTSEKDSESAKVIAAEKKYNDAVKLANGNEIIALVNKAVGDRAITRKDGDNLIELADGNIDKVKKFLEGKTPNTTIKELTGSDVTLSADDAELVKLKGMTYDQLFEVDGALTKLKAADPEAYKAKYKAKFPNSKV